MKCEICAADTRQLFMAHGYWVRNCVGCGHRVAEIEASDNHVASVYDDAYFTGGGAGYSNYFAEGEMLRSRGKWYAKLIGKFTQPGTILDVGAAAGFVLQGFQECGWTGCGIEPNASQAEFARNSLGLQVYTTSLENFTAERTFDLVSMIQVVPHFVNLRRSFKVTAEATHAGSHLLIETWNCQSLTARVFGKAWHEYSPPSVLRWFTPAEIEALAGQFGFKKVGQGRPPKSIAGSHAKSLLSYKLRELPMGGILSKMAAVIPDDLQIPYPSEDLFWILLEKTL